MVGPVATVCIEYALVFAHIVLEVTSLACIQILQEGVSDFQLSTLRLFFQVVFAFIITQWNNDLYKPLVTDMNCLSVVCCAYLFFNVGFYGASKCLPLADHGSLSNFICIIFIMLLHWIFQSQAPGKVNLLAIVVCFAGTVMVVQPTYIFGCNTAMHNESMQTTFTNLSSLKGSCVDHPSHLPATIFCYFLLLIGSASLALIIFTLGQRLNHMITLNQIFWMSLGAFTFSVPLTFYMGPINVRFVFDLKETLLVLGHCTAAGVSVSVGFTAMRLLGGLQYSIALSFTVVFQMVCQFTFLAKYEPGNKNTLAIIGVFVVVIGIALPALLVLVKEKCGPPSNFVMKDIAQNEK